MEGHNEPCYYCGERCSSLAGNPGQWPLALCHSDEPGVVKYHHTSCVSRRLRHRETMLAALEAAEPILRAYIPMALFDGHAAEALRLVRAAIAQAKGESK